jgi:GNAT superfamily N-acetyltransferase
MWRSPVNWAFCNGAYLARNPDGTGEESGDAVLQRILDFFARNACDSFMIWLDEAVDHVAWEPIFAAHGLRHDPGSPCLTLDTRDLPDAQSLSAEVQIVRAGDLAGLAYFGEASGAGFTQDEANINGLIELWTGFGVDGPLECYLAYVDDVIVATAAAHFTLGAVGVEFVSTLPEYRGRGYGSAITQHIAMVARARGYRYVTLSASDMGKPIYERLGFVAAGFADNYYPIDQEP